jgi:hypothetical protein
MVTSCAVVIACIYMHTLEQEALNQFAYQRYIIRAIFLFIRFIDDYIIAVSDYDQGLAFMELLNSRPKNITVTFEICNTEAQFLGLTLYKTSPNTIAVKFYIKPMNKHRFLPPTSCHPPHNFRGWIVGYDRRLKGNNTEERDYTSFINLFESSLQGRGYKRERITIYFSVIPDRETVFQSLTDKPNVGKDISTPFVITYAPAVQQSLNAIKQAIAFTEEARLDPHFNLIFAATTTPLLSFKCGKNLRNLVSPSALSK